MLIIPFLRVLAGWMKILIFTLQVTEFYLQEAQEGQIYYVPNKWWIWVTSSDSFTMSILLETSNASFFINTIYNHSMAVVWSWVNPVRSSYLLSESTSILEILFRYNNMHIHTSACINPAHWNFLQQTHCKLPEYGLRFLLLKGMLLVPSLLEVDSYILSKCFESGCCRSLH